MTFGSLQIVSGETIWVLPEAQSNQKSITEQNAGEVETTRLLRHLGAAQKLDVTTFQSVVRRDNRQPRVLNDL